MTDIPIKIQFVKKLSNLKPSRIIAVKADNSPYFELYITDKTGLPYPIKDESGTDGIVNITSGGGTITITGNSVTKNLEIDSSILALINSSLQAGDNISVLINDANYITLADIPPFNPSDYDLEDFTNNGVDPFAHISEITDGVTNLGYTASPTNGIVTSDTGSDATIPLATETNAGLLSPTEKEKITTALQPNDITNLVPYTGATQNLDLGLFNASGSPAILSSQFTTKSQLAEQVEISSNITVDETHNNKILIFTANCTLTIPATLSANYSFEGVTLAGVTLSWAITSPKTWLFGTPQSVTEKQIFTLMQRGNTNSIMLLGV